LQLLEEAMDLGLFCQDIPPFQLSTALQWGLKMWLKTYGPLLTYRQVSIVISHSLLTGHLNTNATNLYSECTWFEFLWGYQLFCLVFSFLPANARNIIRNLQYLILLATHYKIFCDKLCVHFQLRHLQFRLMREYINEGSKTFVYFPGRKHFEQLSIVPLHINLWKTL
jgi:hypothetical protein